MRRGGRQARKARQRRRLVESAAVSTATALHEAIPQGSALGESLGRTEGGGQRREITVIEAGWGSSGYYAREVLARDVPRAFPVGTHMYLNHPTESEDAERPERDVRDLAAVITKRPSMQGDAVVAECEVFEHYAPLIDAIAPHIGTSIRAMGEAEQGEAEGRTGPLIRSLDEGISLDFVTKPGAGGKVGARLLESARGVAGATLEEARNAGQWLEASIHREFTLTADSLFGNGYVTREERVAMSAAIGSALDAFTESLKESSPGLYERDPYADLTQHEVGVEEGSKAASGRETSNKEDAMSEGAEAKLAELEESVRKLTERADAADSALADEKKRADRAEEALDRVHAEKVVADTTISEDGAEPVSVFKGLPQKAVDRVKESALKDELPRTEDGKLHVEHLEERVRAAAKEEREYLASAGVGVSGSARVVGMGESSPATSNDGSDKLKESFGRLGMTEQTAARAAEGR